MIRRTLALLASALWAATALPAQTATICTLLMDADTGQTLLEQGDCTTRVTPASTFKIALAVMGFDAGLLHGPDSPIMSFRPGDPDWGGANWTRDTGPADWMRHSVLWYSQRLTRDMGQQTLTRYAQGFGYGNADLSGDPGHDNGLERAWIASSLTISPREQASFLRALLTDSLPVQPQAMARTRALLDTHPVAGWTLHGKTGTAYPRRADRSFDYARGWGWYVGWASRANDRVIFARLTQTTERGPGSPGIMTRDGLLKDWPHLVAP
jgi:beta-lactamase class D